MAIHGIETTAMQPSSTAAGLVSSRIRGPMRGIAIGLTVGLLLLTIGVQPASADNSTDVGVRTSGVRVTVTFDVGTAPCAFNNTQALRDEFADVGVHFRGDTDTGGGAILNQCGAFGVDARSGREFLAFNKGTYAKLPQRIRFDDLQRRVSLFAANGNGNGRTTRFRLVGKRDGEIVSRAVVATTTRRYSELKVVSAQGLDAVVLRAQVPGGYFVVDDLEFAPLT